MLEWKECSTMCSFSLSAVLIRAQPVLDQDFPVPSLTEVLGQAGEGLGGLTTAQGGVVLGTTK